MSVQAAGDVAQSIQAVNQVLQNAQSAQTEQAMKVVKTQVAMAVQSPSQGLGQLVDVVA